MISGVSNSLDSLFRLSNAETRSISAENLAGNKASGGMATTGFGAKYARDLGLGWKISPCIELAPKNTISIAEIEGPGAIQHIWMTLGQVNNCDVWKDIIFRAYWDGAETPAIEVPVGDFFANGWNEYAHVNSLAVCVNPARGFNCYWTMPFFHNAKITIENRNPNPVVLYYQIDYALTEIPNDSAYFCASYRQSKPTINGIHTIIDGIKGQGQYVGTYITWQVNNNGWWGEGEIKFYIDDDKDYPTICGTGTEDYFCGAYNYDVPGNGYTAYSTAYSGLPQIIRPDGLYKANTRFGMYRWHINDPIRFKSNLSVTIQDLGWHSEGRFLIQKSNITSVAYWYQNGPIQPLKTLGSRDDLEIV